MGLHLFTLNQKAEGIGVHWWHPFLSMFHGKKQGRECRDRFQGTMNNVHWVRVNLLHSKAISIYDNWSHTFHGQDCEGCECEHSLRYPGLLQQHTTDWVTQTKETYLSWFWSLEVWDGADGMVGFWRKLCQGCRLPASTRVLTRGEKCCLASSCKDVNSMCEGPTNDVIFPEWSPPNAIPLGLDFNTWLLRQHQHSVHNKHFKYVVDLAPRSSSGCLRMWSYSFSLGKHKLKSTYLLTCMFSRLKSYSSP